MVLMSLGLGLGGCALQGLHGEAGANVSLAAPSETAPKSTAEQAPARRASVSRQAAPKPTTVMSSLQRQPTPTQGETTCTDVEKCASVLKTMVTGTDRSWMRQRAAPTVLANGVRLFAYRALRPSLSCGELASALSEVDAASRTFRGPVPGVEAGQAERVRSLSGEVAGELRAERARRCASHGDSDGSIG
jgi:hypothetical protein